MHVRSVSSSYTSSIRYISLLMDFFCLPLLLSLSNACSLARSLSACLRTTTMKLNFITLGIPIANSLHWEFSFQSIANNLDACRSSTMKCLQFHLFSSWRWNFALTLNRLQCISKGMLKIKKVEEEKGVYVNEYIGCQPLFDEIVE